jgi:hypothetical protein
MSVTHNGITIKSMTHDGSIVKSWVHDGVEVFKLITERLVINNSTMNTSYITTLIRGSLGGDNVSYNRQTVTTSNCKFTYKFIYPVNYTRYNWFGTPLIDVTGFTKCDITFTNPKIDSEYSTDSTTVCLSTTAPNGYKATVNNIGAGGTNDFSMTGISPINSANADGTKTVTLTFSNRTKLAIIFYFISNEGVLDGKTKTIQINKIRLYN